MGQPRRPDQNFDPPIGSAPVSSQAGIFRGRLVVIGSSGPPGSGLFVYSPSPGTGDLFVSISGGSGLDSFGNPVSKGVVIYGPGPTGAETAQMQLGVTNTGQPVIAWASGATSETRTAQITETVTNPNTTSEVIQVVFAGPQGGAANPNDSVLLQMLSSSAAAPAISTAFMIYEDTAGTQHQVAFWGQHGFNGAITQAIVGQQPGTINTTLAAETWHTITPTGAGFAAGSPAPRYRFEPIGSGGQVRLAGVISVTANTLAAAAIVTLPAGYHPTAAQSFVTTNSTGSVSGGSVSVTTGGVIQCAPASANGDAIFLDGITFPLD